MYAVNRVSSHASAPSVPDFEGIKRLIHFLDGCSHCTIMYPTGLDGTTTHDLCQEVSPGNFQSQKISSDLVDLVDGGEGLPPNYKCTISGVIFCLFGVSIHCSEQTQPAYAAHSVHS